MKYKWNDDAREKVISGWKDLKYGMFVHFGLFSLCGGMWNGKPVTYGYSEQILSHGPIPHIDYERLASQLTIEKFNADEIASLAKDAGMNYIVMMTKHHDGFCLFDTDTTDYNSVHSACHKDVIAEMSEACRKAGLKFGLYYSWIDWHYPYALPISSHNSDAIPPLHMQYNLDQLTELLSNYGPICELWMDMGAPTKDQSESVRELAHRLQPGIMINGRIWNDCGDFVTMADNGYPDCSLDVPWQTPATVYHETWGYRSWQKRDDLPGKVKAISENLFRVLDGGGNYLLNIGPEGDGSVVPFERDVLLEIRKKIDERGGLDRHCPCEIASESIDGNEAVVLENGTPHFRYTGSEYYSLRKIITAYSWNLDLKHDGDYRLSYLLDEPLKHEQKLCIDTPDETFIFPMKENKQEFGICSSVHLGKGLNTISLYTQGPTISRPEFPGIVVRLKLERL
ncbi:MAG: alpha-L-fucosidase [Sphaerochaetaceae bacterium]|nr:alpha-L-fucosidase [Sphaerochaetaceae bacterium]